MEIVNKPYTTTFNIDEYEDAKSGTINGINFKNGDKIIAKNDRHNGEGTLLIRWRNKKWVFLVADYYFQTEPIDKFSTIQKQ